MSNSKARKQRLAQERSTKKSEPKTAPTAPTPTGIVPVLVDDLSLAFGGDMRKLLPAYDSIPDEFKRDRNKWCKVVSDWFFLGLKGAQWQPKPGIDQTAALRHIKAILGSWEPKHEHKEAGVAYLLSLWFNDVTYQTS